MGFKEENYTPKGLCLCMVLWSLISMGQLAAQSAPHCPVRVDLEPRVESQTQIANDLAQTNFPFFTSWENVSLSRQSDDAYATVSLDAYRRSTMMLGTNTSLQVPAGAKITGLELLIEGHSRGSGHAEGSVVQLTDEQGQTIGDNKAYTPLPLDKDWPTTADSSDFIWRYGTATDTWGLDLTAAMINSSGFGYAIQVRNKLSSPVEVLIDQVYVIVHYIPLYTICDDHACVPFYVDEIEGNNISYEWYIPEGWKLVSDSEHDAVINIGPSYATFGTYELCVESFEGSLSQGVCCRQFNYTDCTPGLISGTVLLDKNGSFTGDLGDTPLSDVLVHLHDLSGNTLSTTSTDDQGNYSFSTLEGSYYLSVTPPSDSLVFAPAAIGSATVDSDFDGSFGIGTTGAIEVISGGSVENIDAILSPRLTIGDFIWEDHNADGIQQSNENGIEGVSITLSNTTTGTQQDVTSDAEGYYDFGVLPSGEYLLTFTAPTEYIPTTPNVSDPTTDSDNTGGSIALSLVAGGAVDTVDAGYFRYASIGDYVWEDLDMDGIQDENEIGIEGILLRLLDADGVVLDSTLSDTTGAYLFSELMPGTYSIEAVKDISLTPSPLTSANADIDSDGILIDGRVIADQITVSSGEVNNTIDFGFFALPAEINGFTWIDGDFDGQYQSDEPFLADVRVFLRNSDGDIIQEAVSDNGGFFGFADIPAGDYYLEYGMPEGYAFTLSNIGSDISDSDVDGQFGLGTTSIFSVLPGSLSADNAAGYFLLPSVGDFVWEDLNYDGLQDPGEPGINGITVELYDLNGVLIQSTITSTDVNTLRDGFYSFSSVDTGDYYIVFEEIDSLIFTIVDAANDALNSDVTGVNGSGSTTTFSLSPNEVNDDIDAGYYEYGTIGNFVWKDENKNGLQDEGELGIPNAEVSLTVNTFTILETTVTDENGYYQFDSLIPGTYKIRTEFIPRLTPTEKNNGTDPDIDSDGLPLLDGFIISDEIDITSGSYRDDIDFGFFDTPIRLGGLAWLDTNNDGQYDTNSETLLEGIAVSLLDATGGEVAITATSEEGFYVFDDIAPGAYYIVFDSTFDKIFTAPNIGDDSTDSDVTNSFSIGSTDIIQVIQGDQFFDIHGGYLLRPQVGDYVWLDTDRDGIQDADEMGLNDIAVTLYNSEGSVLAVTMTTVDPTTENSGYYLFDNLDTGSYYLVFQEVDSLDFTTEFGGATDTDSDVNSNITYGSTSFFTLQGNEQRLDIDAGYILNQSSISGEVWVDADLDGVQADDDLLLSGIVVRLLASDDNEIATTTTDPLGQYRFDQINTGTYYITFDLGERYLSTLPNIGVDESADSDITESQASNSTDLFTTTGQDVLDIDAGVVDGAISLDGRVWIDSNNNGILEITESPMDSAVIRLFTTDGTLVDSMFSDEDGLYSFDRVLAGEYYLTFSPSEPAYINVAADQGTDDNIDDDVTGSITGGSTDLITVSYFIDLPDVNAGYYLVASIGDYAFIDLNENGINDGEPGLNGVVVHLLNTDGMIVQSTVTAPGGGLDSGYYELTDVIPGEYQLQFISPTSYQFTDGDQGGDDTIDSDITGINANTGTTDLFTIESGEDNSTIDAGFVVNVIAESSISGVIWDDLNADGINTMDEERRSLLAVMLLDEAGQIIDMRLSQADGTYMFEMLPEGIYTVRISLPEGQTATAKDIGDDATDSDFMPVGTSLETESFFLANFENKINVDLGVVEEVSIGDFVWQDLNNNGTQEVIESGIGDVEITATHLVSGEIFSTSTDADGGYNFLNIPGGMYQVCMTTPAEYSIGQKDQGIEQLDSDANADGCTDPISILTGDNFDIDFALLLNGSVSGMAFVDLNGNGVSSAQEPGLENVGVSLFDASGTLVASTTTSADQMTLGSYQFENIPAGDYYVEFTFPAAYIFTDANSGPEEVDSDVTGAFGMGTTDLFSVASGESVIQVDAGAYLPATIGDRVWEDANENGIQDPGEAGIEGIEVVIFRSFGIPFDTVYTDAEGRYGFSDLKQGLYFIQFMIPQQFSISPADVGINDEIDSDSDATGKTPLISLAHGAMLSTIDCGIFTSMASLRSVVWEDLNGDGVRQAQEARIPDIRITLYDADDIAVQSTVTNSLGLYAFEQIPPGDYSVFVDLSLTDYSFTDMDMSADDLHDSDIHPDGRSSTFSSAEVLSVPNIDVGLFETAEIHGIVWDDTDQDATFGIEELPLEGVDVRLYDDMHNLIQQQITTDDQEENVSFMAVRPGTYYMTYSTDESWRPSMSDEPLDQDHNSDLSLIGDQCLTSLFTVPSGQVVGYVDAGFYQSPTITSEPVDAQMSTTTAGKDNPQVITSTVDPDDVDISIHPNPATNYVRIKTSHSGEAKVVIRNSQNQILLSTMADVASKIDLSSLHPGVYYISIMMDGKNLTKKFIKVH